MKLQEPERRREKGENIIYIRVEFSIVGATRRSADTPCRMNESRITFRLIRVSVSYLILNPLLISKRAKSHYLLRTSRESRRLKNYSSIFNEYNNVIKSYSITSILLLVVCKNMDMSSPPEWCLSICILHTGICIILQLNFPIKKAKFPHYFQLANNSFGNLMLFFFFAIVMKERKRALVQLPFNSLTRCCVLLSR